MKKLTIGFILFLLAWQLHAANTLKIGQYQVLPTTNFVVQLEAENSEQFVAFQVDIPIPTGFKYVDGSAVLNVSRISGHALSANLLTGNILRLIGYSIGNTAFLGNSGSLVSFTLKSGAVPATFPLELNQALLGDSQSNNILTSSINGQVTVLAPNISLSATELNYGRIPLGTVAEQSFQINNTGNSDLIITSLNFNDAQFSTTEPSNFTISANSSRNILVKFTPSVKATLAKQLQIGSNDPDQPTANIALNAVAFAVNEIHTGNITAASSTTAKLDFTLNNMETFTGFQFDLNLPPPMTYIAGTAQMFRSQNQTVSVNQINSQTLRVVVFSAGNKNFSGTNGKVLSLDFLLKGIAGYYSIGISNVIIANAIGENIVSDSYQGYLQISSPDIESSSQINFGDVSILASSTQQQRIYNYGQEPLNISQLVFSNSYFKSNQTLPIIIQPGNYFDVPIEFAKIVKGSATGTLKIISNDPDENPFTVKLSGNAFTPNYLLINTQKMIVGDSKVVAVEIENEEPFVALQFDLTFPEGFTPDLNAIALSARKQDHVLAAISLSNTSVRIIAYSPSQKAFTGKSGSVLTIPFMSNGLPVGTYNLTLSNSLLSNIKSENILYSVKNGVLDVVFGTKPSIVLTSPNGGESWTVNTTKQISWNSSNVSNVKIEYSTNGGIDWNSIISSTLATTGSYTWTVANSISTNCKIRISDVLNPETNDMSDAAFSIVAEPISTNTTIPMTISNWFSNCCGAVQETSEGVQLWGAGYRSGNSIISKDFYDLSNNAEIYMKWKVNGNGTYMYVGQGAYQTIGCNFTTGWSYSGSILVSDNTWYYTHIKINSDYSYSFVTSTNDYDDNGGTVRYSFSNTIAPDRQYFIRNSQLIFQIADNYGSTGAWMVAAELKLKNATKIALTKVVSSIFDFENNAIPQGFALYGDWDIANTGNNSNYSIHVNSGSENKYFTITKGDVFGISYDIKSISGSSYKQPVLTIDDKYGFGGDNSSSGCWRNNIYTFPSKSTHTFKFEIPTSVYSSENVETWIDNIVFLTNTNVFTDIIILNDGSISIYPNPVSNELTIEISLQSKPVNFEIVNLLGQVIYKGNVTGKTVVNTSCISQGVYFVKIPNGKSFEFRKVVKK